MLGHYAGLAPLRAITEEFKRRTLGAEQHSGSARNAATMQSPALRKQLDAMSKQLDDIKANEERLEITLAALQKVTTPKAFVVNCDSGRWHRCRDDALDGPPSLWAAICGWKYANAKFTRARVFPDDVRSALLCERCLPFEKADARLNEATTITSCVRLRGLRAVGHLIDSCRPLTLLSSRAH